MEDLLKNNSNDAGSKTQGKIAKAIENQTAKLPSDLFLWATFGSMGVVAMLKFLGKVHQILFVGRWVAPFLLLGIYNNRKSGRP